MIIKIEGQETTLKVVSNHTGLGIAELHSKIKKCKGKFLYLEDLTLEISKPIGVVPKVSHRGAKKLIMPYVWDGERVLEDKTLLFLAAEFKTTVSVLHRKLRENPSFFVHQNNIFSNLPMFEKLEDLKHHGHNGKRYFFGSLRAIHEKSEIKPCLVTVSNKLNHSKHYISGDFTFTRNY